MKVRAFKQEDSMLVVGPNKLIVLALVKFDLLDVCHSFWVK